ncbi:PIN2/TERF1-interacting telomerase inhibitor 1 [Plodia interpunctella]|uniref:PIN2/TERF1-interacting telomerase inhibitor 1 n=1 Tax=Plodia interpunctella TaxID=58824 RepID=UPI002368B808|nr:PIN2/TERF1-interacting telomerase inhibitor 1 [Plodia interpunctella]
MSMLAGPRRKQKVINLRAKNNAWSNDSSKFGQRMLEKMGWTTGKGLGANENGIVEHVVARYKNDEKGLGFEDKNDQWTKHEDDFNALLANLSNDDASVEKLHSGISLEVKSKKSKARVHYHKFTRGKDLTRYSEKDLANIFGKKSLKSEEKTEKIILKDVKHMKETEQVFTEKGSMEDYFKSKLAAFKSKSTLLFNKNVIKDEDENAEYVFLGFSTNCDEPEQNIKMSEYEQFSFYSSNTDNSNLRLGETNEQSCEHDGKVKKKKKKSKELESNITDVSEGVINLNNRSEADNCNILVSEKKTKRKFKHEDMETEEVLLEITEEIVPLKKSKINSEYPTEIQEENIPKKKKKNKKNKSLVTEIIQENAETDVIEENADDTCSLVTKKKKKKKNKYEE